MSHTRRVGPRRTVRAGLAWTMAVGGTALVLAAAIVWINPTRATSTDPAALSSAGSGDPTAAAPPTAGPSSDQVTPSATPLTAKDVRMPLELRAASISVPTGAFLAWALMDRRTGQTWGSTTMAQTTWTASMIKAWLAADYLRRAAAAGVKPSQSELADLETMIRDSANLPTEAIYEANGSSASIYRLISMCHLTDTSPRPGEWSYTNMSARDAVRMADCIADGTAAGPQWTAWVLQMMRGVRGEGDFGIRDAFPPAEAATIAVKNGWLDYDDDDVWRVNCLAVTDTWALSVLQRFPDADSISLVTARQNCRDVAKQLINPAYEALR